MQTWKEKLSTFFSEEELDEIEEYDLQKRLVQILCFQKNCNLSAGHLCFRGDEIEEFAEGFINGFTDDQGNLAAQAACEDEPRPYHCNCPGDCNH